MTEAFSEKTFPSIEEVKRKSLRRTLASATVGLTGVALNKVGIDAAHIDNALTIGGGGGTFVYGTRYIGGLLFSHLDELDMPPRMPADQRNEIHDLLEQNSLDNLENPPPTE